MTVGLIVLVGVMLAGACCASAQQADGDEQPPPLNVGVKIAPPFVMKDSDGGFHGLSIDLWRKIADELHLEYELREYTLEEMLERVARSELDLALGAVSVTSQREQDMDFSHPFHLTGLAIAAPSDAEERGWWRVLNGVFSVQFFVAVGLLALLLLGAGALVWVFEARRNREMFGGGAARGLSSGFWWAAVTMTTVGYGDKAPKTVGGRTVALVWMFASLIVISSFTASIAASLTVGQLSGAVAGLNDLAIARTGTVAASPSAAYLTAHGIGFESFADTQSGLRALADGRIDAFVYDEPLLRYLVMTEFHGLVIVLPETFNRQAYGIPLPTGSALREPINRQLLEYVDSDDWDLLVRRYLGRN